MEELTHKYLNANYILDDKLGIRVKDTDALFLFPRISLREDLLGVFGDAKALEYGITWLGSKGLVVDSDYFNEPPPGLMQQIRELAKMAKSFGFNKELNF